MKSAKARRLKSGEVTKGKHGQATYGKEKLRKMKNQDRKALGKSLIQSGPKGKLPESSYRDYLLSILEKRFDSEGNPIPRHKREFDVGQKMADKEFKDPSTGKVNKARREKLKKASASGKSSASAGMADRSKKLRSMSNESYKEYLIGLIEGGSQDSKEDSLDRGRRLAGHTISRGIKKMNPKMKGKKVHGSFSTTVKHEIDSTPKRKYNK